jgi:hypothetical protein
MSRSSRLIVAALSACLIVSSGATTASAASLASDNAGNYTTWSNGDNLGTGFGPWDLQQLGNNNSNAFAGQFLAGSGNGDLNFIGSAPNNRAWGLYANDNSIDSSASDTLESSAAFRSFTGGGLAVGQSFVVRMEHGNIDDVGSNNPVNVSSVGNLGWVGIVLSPFPGNGANPLTPFANTSGVPAFGFQGGLSTYNVYDNFSPSGRAFAGGALGFTSDGLEITFSATSASSYTITVKNLATNQVFTETGTGTIAGVQTFGLYNRNSEQANVYFNSLAVVPEPASLALLFAGAAALLRRGK